MILVSINPRKALKDVWPADDSLPLVSEHSVVLSVKITVIVLLMLVVWRI